MEVVTIDLTNQKEVIAFFGSSNEDVSYAKTFWQSFQLHPPMESRLVSSDIKQRLKVAPPGSQSINYTYMSSKYAEDNKEFFLRAKTKEYLENYEKLSHLAEAREEDRRLLNKRRKERLEKEKLSNHKGVTKPQNMLPVDSKYIDLQTEAAMALEDLTTFDEKKKENDDLSD